MSNIIRKTYGSENSPVIAFGGSYGASWLRIMYPSAVAGGDCVWFVFSLPTLIPYFIALAASAPIWGFPMMDTCPLDGSAQIVTYTASAEGL